MRAVRSGPLTSVLVIVNFEVLLLLDLLVFIAVLARPPSFALLFAILALLLPSAFSYSSRALSAHTQDGPVQPGFRRHTSVFRLACFRGV